MGNFLKGIFTQIIWFVVIHRIHVCYYCSVSYLISHNHICMICWILYFLHVYSSSVFSFFFAFLIIWDTHLFYHSLALYNNKYALVLFQSYKKYSSQRPWNNHIPDLLLCTLTQFLLNPLNLVIWCPLVKFLWGIKLLHNL